MLVLAVDLNMLYPLQELGRLDDSANVFKLIGPALIKQVRCSSSSTQRLHVATGSALVSRSACC